MCEWSSECDDKTRAASNYSNATAVSLNQASFDGSIYDTTFDIQAVEFTAKTYSSPARTVELSKRPALIKCE
jgi:hypothetical protein